MERDVGQLAEAVRGACLEAAVAAWEQAGISGLCADGRWEMAVQAIRELDLNRATESIRRRPRAP